MEDIDYVQFWVEEHMRRCSLDALDGKAVLELGPGDALTTAVVAAAHGASSIVLVDETDFASRDVSLYRGLADALRSRGLDAPDLAGSRTIEDVLGACSATYLVDGVRSLVALPDGSIDVSWSQAVLEHVRRDEIPTLLRELHRVHRPGTMSSHRIDFQDHLARGLNHLRFSSRWWERPAIYRSGVYTNRLRVSGVMAEFAAAGFGIEELGRRSWSEPPIRRRALAEEFRALSRDDLCCAEADLVARAEPVTP